MKRLNISQALKYKMITDEQASQLRCESRRRNRDICQPETFCALSNLSPQVRLWRLVAPVYPGRAKWEYSRAVPGRQFRIDIAFPAEKLAIEVDGWQYHGMRKKDFQRDRIKQNLLVIHGWKILRYFVYEINNQQDNILYQIKTVLTCSNMPGGKK